MTEVRRASKVLQIKSTLSLAILVLSLALDTRPRSKLCSKHLPGDDWMVLQSRTQTVLHARTIACARHSTAHSAYT